MIARRKVIQAIGACALTASQAAYGQPSGIWRIGILEFTDAAHSLVEEFTRALGELGYVEGRNVVYERRYANGKPDRLPALAANLVGSTPREGLSDSPIVLFRRSAG